MRWKTSKHCVLLLKFWREQECLTTHLSKFLKAIVIELCFLVSKMKNRWINDNFSSLKEKQLIF